jgi:hypothetical protein
MTSPPPAATAQPASPPSQPATASAERAPAAPATPPAAPAQPPPAPAPAPPADPVGMRLAVQTEGAIGVYPGDFYNHFVGARLDLVFSPHVSFGGYLGYVNLKGKDGRAHNLLPYAQVEYMFGTPGRLRVPLRFASGYLTNNGPVVRLSGGVAFPLTPKIDLVTEVLAPMIWMTGDQMVISMNLAAELLYRF